MSKIVRCPKCKSVEGVYIMVRQFFAPDIEEKEYIQLGKERDDWENRVMICADCGSSEDDVGDFLIEEGVR